MAARSRQHSSHCSAAATDAVMPPNCCRCRQAGRRCCHAAATANAALPPSCCLPVNCSCHCCFHCPCRRHFQLIVDCCLCPCHLIQVATHLGSHCPNPTLSSTPAGPLLPSTPSIDCHRHCHHHLPLLSSSSAVVVDHHRRQPPPSLPSLSVAAPRHHHGKAS